MASARGRLPTHGLRVVAATGLALVLAGCGSQLDPVTVARANTDTVALQGQDRAGGAATVSGPAGVGDGEGSGAASGREDVSGSAGGTTDGAGASGGSAPRGSGPEGPGRDPTGGAVKAGSCAGLKNQTGITDDKIVIANASDISGPVPGLFEAAREATRAFAAYFNAGSDICGRKLEVLALDSRSDAGGDQQAYANACEEAFAAVGSMSAFDAGGARTAQGCGLPDLRSTMVTPERRACSTCFAAMAVNPSLVPSSMPKYWLGRNREATQHVALLYINVGAAAVNAQSFKKAWERVGWKVDYFDSIDVSEFNYAPYVQQMKKRGIRLVSYAGPYQNTVRLQQAMKQQGFKPDAFLQDATIYDQNYVDQAGADGEGSYVYSTTALFDDVSIKEMQLYRSWLNQVSPNAVPNYYGLYAWSAARLFAEQAVALGGRLSRPALVDALSKVRSWTGHGLHAPQQVGAKVTANCVRIIQLRGGRWSQVSPGGYMCGPLVDTGVGG
jgi:ABC-type branched-subunit amino acid transport system substrate-binding protein